MKISKSNKNSSIFCIKTFILRALPSIHSIPNIRRKTILKSSILIFSENILTGDPTTVSTRYQCALTRLVEITDQNSLNNKHINPIMRFFSRPHASIPPDYHTTLFMVPQNIHIPTTTYTIYTILRAMHLAYINRYICTINNTSTSYFPLHHPKKLR